MCLCALLYTVILLMITVQAVGEHSGVSLIVKPEVIPSSSLEVNGQSSFGWLPGLSRGVYKSKAENEAAGIRVYIMLRHRQIFVKRQG